MIKQVPQNLQAIFNEDNSLNREESVKGMNPSDKCALLHAVALANGEEDRVIALSMGPPSAEEVLREAIAFGAHEGVLLEDRRFAGSDTYATALILSAALKKIRPDLVLCGRRAIDGETGQVGPEVAVRLGMNCVTNILRFSVQNDSVTADRLLTNRIDTVSVPLPAVISVMENLDVTALPSISGFRRARNASVEHWNAETIAVKEAECGIRGSKTSVAKTYVAAAAARKTVFLDSAEAGIRLISERLSNQ